MKFTVEGRETVLDVIEADDKEQALKKFHAKYPAVDKIVIIKEGNKPWKRTVEFIKETEYDAINEDGEHYVREVPVGTKGTIVPYSGDGFFQVKLGKEFQNKVIWVEPDEFKRTNK